ncbi:helix-turn-helix domain-containing protein [Pararhodobacter sp.]|uniref:helix-turn-helix domain-containing protein n=1 Tax=Pararhodobacter sp. TaxID=2127056 RepID=UPI002AFF9C67|nr:helix-turn-helix domain-containing protein [Pararhodobacter sp.]
MTNLPRPPAHLEAYVRILGVEGAITFLLNYGGGELYIPRNAVAGSPLAELLGLDAARALGAAADRLPKRVPTGKPWIAQIRAAQGLSATQIARTLHASDVSVRKWLKAAKRPADPRQFPLI